MKTIINILMVWLCVCIATPLFSQNKYGCNFVFSSDKGLRFVDTSAMPKQFSVNCMAAYNNSAAISNKRGKLLMYYRQDSIEVYASGKWYPASKAYGSIADSSGNTIQGADSIYAAIGVDGSTLFLPDPIDSTVFWFFGMEFNANASDTNNHLMYIKFKVSSNNISVLKRVDYACNYNFRNAIRAIRHGNGRDWWLISKNNGSNEWIRFLLAPNGLSTPMFQTYGTMIYSYGGFGSMDVSVDGQHLFLPGQPFITSFSFDRCTGLLSNYQRFDDGTIYNQFVIQNYYQSSFYDTATKTVIGFGSQNIVAYNLGVPDTLITKYKIVKTLSSYSDTSNANAYGCMFYNPLNAEHLYIYISQEMSNWTFYADSLRNTISLVDYSDTAHITVTDKFIVTNLYEIFAPAFPQPNYNLGALKESFCDTIVGTQNITPIENDIKIYPNPTNYSVNIDIPSQSVCTITDITGRKLQNINLSEGLQKIKLDQYANGIYLLDFVPVGSGEHIIKKIVVQR